MYILTINGSIGKVLRIADMFGKVVSLCYIVDEEELMLAKLKGDVLAIYSDEEYAKFAIEECNESDTDEVIYLKFIVAAMFVYEGMSSDLYFSYRSMVK